MNSAIAIKQARQEISKHRLGSGWVVCDYDGREIGPVNYDKANLILQGRRLHRALVLMGFDAQTVEDICRIRELTGKDWRECVPPSK